MNRRAVIIGLLIFGCINILNGYVERAKSQVNSRENFAFNVVNASHLTISGIYISASSSSNWGRDLLGEDVLEPGRTFVTNLSSSQCVKDIRVVFQSGQTEERRQIDVCNSKIFLVGGGGSAGQMPNLEAPTPFSTGRPPSLEAPTPFPTRPPLR